MGDVFEVAEVVFGRFATVGYSGLSQPEQVFICVWSADGEIGNGGFDQFFFNSSGDIALDCPAAYLAIGATGLANLVARANALFPAPGPSADRDARCIQLDTLGDAAETSMRAFDAEYYASTENVTELLEAYVASHESDFAG